MNWYKLDNIKAHVKISQYLTDKGVKMQGNRAVAAWRDGQRMSVSIDDEKGVWHDFVAEEGGDVISLYTKLEGGSFIEACRELGDRYHLTPDKVSRKPPKMTHGEILVRDGFKLTKTYTYQNADGSPRYYVDRYEKLDADGKKVKEFDQRGPNARNLAGIEKTIYHLPAVIATSRVFIVEGEKDADTLTQMGLTATTNSGGAKNWCAEFNAFFDGKDVVILPDNDEKGQEHGKIVAGNVAPFAKQVRVVTLSKQPKGDVTDWVDREGGDLAQLMDAINAAPPPLIMSPEVAAAKLANKEPLKNYALGEPIVDAKGRPHERREPRQVNEICDEIATRFLGFPKRIGSQLFDFTRAANFKDRKILSILTADDLKAWINGTSCHQSEFQAGSPFATYKEVYSRLMQTRPSFEVIAKAPWYPVRDDAFAAYEALPPPDSTRSKIDELMSFFLPATDADRTLMLAFFMAPMLNTAASRPAWIVDTVDAQASGKTTVVKACAWLYNENPIALDLKTLDGDLTQVKKRILSTDGRAKRIALFDNVTASLKSGNLSDLVTAETITGMAPYGHGEETRKNDITWCATVNGASVDTDMATRSYVIHIRKPGPNADPLWEKHLREFIETNRPQLHADIMDALRTATMRRRQSSRFGEFDAIVLSAACRTDAEFAAADAAIRAAAETANDDADLAAQCVEAISNALMEYDRDKGVVDGDKPCVLRCSDVDNILRRTQGGVKNWTSKIVRRFVNSGNIKNIVKGVERIDTADGRRLFGRSRCFVFAANSDVLASATTAQFITFAGAVPSVLGVGNV